MARPLRIQRPGGRYHVVARGNERKAIFRDDTDRFHFLELLGELGQHFGVRVHAYVLMDSLYGVTGFGGLYSDGSIFRLTVIPDPPMLQSVSQANGFLNFTWNANTGRSYQVQYATNLSQPTWLNFGGSFVATNTLSTVSDSLNGGVQRFYRVILFP